jgi:hypothetical protein
MAPFVETLRQFIDSMSKRPGMYIHPVSVDQFAAAIMGYEQALFDAGVYRRDYVDGFSRQFSRWLGQRWGVATNIVWVSH